MSNKSTATIELPVNHTKDKYNNSHKAITLTDDNSKQVLSNFSKFIQQTADNLTTLQNRQNILQTVITELESKMLSASESSQSNNHLTGYYSSMIQLISDEIRFLQDFKNNY